MLKFKSFFLFILIVLVGLCGYFTNKAKGILDRYPEDVIAITSTAFDNYSMHPYVNDNCIKRYPEMADFHSCLLSLPKDPKVLILGDSHGLQYYQSFKEQLKDVSVMNISEFICLPFISDWIANESSKTCSEKSSRISAFLNKNQSIETVILIGRWNTLVSFDKGYLNRNFKLSSDIDYQTFVNNGSQLIHKLLNLRKKIIIFLDNPETKSDLRSCIRNNYKEFKEDRCLINRIDFEKKIFLYEYALQELSKNFPELVVINPRETLCDEDYCPILKDGKLYYFDNNHLTKFSSDIVVKNFLSNYNLN
jgi:hypothetical protein